MHTADELLDQAATKVTSPLMRHRLAEMVRDACRQNKLLPGCTMPLPERGRWVMLPSTWPLRIAKTELADGRIRRLGLDRKRKRWFVR